MRSIRTHILIPNDLFEQADKLAREMKISRSRLFAIAMEEYIQRRRNRELLEQINAAYSDEADAEEEALRRFIKREHRRLVEGEW
jgi:metal-responsive CopG/Arc/MetJ family transcriptional regulator